jgi:glycerol uptake facilitator protein
MNAVNVGGLGATAPFPGIGYWQAILAEAIGTFLLMLTIMGVAVDERAPPGFAGLIIGLTVGGIITTTGNIAGSSLNPARTFGPYLGDYSGRKQPLAVLSDIHHWADSGRDYCRLPL